MEELNLEVLRAELGMQEDESFSDVVDDADEDGDFNEEEGGGDTDDEDVNISDDGEDDEDQ